jgi:hypothetical protein
MASSAAFSGGRPGSQAAWKGRPPGTLSQKEQYERYLAQNFQARGEGAPPPCRAEQGC